MEKSVNVSGPRSNAAVALAIFVLTLAAYLYHAQYRLYGAGGDTTPAELLPVSVLDHHTLTFDWTAGDRRLSDPGQTRGPFYWFTSSRGHLISYYPIVPGLLNIPVYAAARAVGVRDLVQSASLLSMITASLLTAASVMFVYLTLLRLCARRSTAILFTLVYAFGTAAFGVAIRGMWQHGPSIVFLAMGMWLLASETDATAALAGLPLGFAIWNRPTNILLVAPLVVYLVFHRRRALPGFAVMGSVPLLLMCAYSEVYWGNIRSLGQYSVGVSWFNTAIGDGLSGIFVSPSRGLLIFSPIFAFALLALGRVRERPLVAYAFAGLPLFFLLYSKWYSWYGGWCFGYRLLTEAIVPLTLVLAVWWEGRAARRLTGVLFAVALAWSVYANAIGAYIYPCGFNWQPNRINEHPERLWSWGDGELARCSSRVLARLRQKI